MSVRWVAGWVIGITALSNAGCDRVKNMGDGGEAPPDGQAMGGPGCPGAGGADGGGGPAACPFTGCTATVPAPGTSLRSVWIAPTGDTWTAGDAGLVGRRATAGGWCWCVQPTGPSLTAVAGSADSDVWIAGAGGTLLHWTGSAFESAPGVAPGKQLAGAWATAANDVWVVGDQGAIRHFDGASWSALDVGSENTLRAVWGTDSAHVWVGGSYPTMVPSTELAGSAATIFQRTATGWDETVPFSQGYGAAWVSAIDGTSATDIWAVGVDQPAGAAAAFSTAIHFDGASWTMPSTPVDFYINTMLTGVAAGPPDAPAGAWMVGGAQGLLTDGMGTWTKSTNPLLASMIAVRARAGAMWAVGRDVTVARWQGTDWIADFGPLPAP